MSYGTILARLRKEKGYTQAEVAEYISKFAKKPYTLAMVSHWENGVSLPPVEQFLLMCKLYDVADIQETFLGYKKEHHNFSKLNQLGKSRANEYIAMLSMSSMFSEPDVSDMSNTSDTSGTSDTANMPNMPGIAKPSASYIKLYDTPAAAGSGEYLDGESYTELPIDKTIPSNADFAIKVSGDSMEPRFVDGQIVFIHQQQTLEVGEIGIFALSGDSYIKKLGHGELISLNPIYKPIKIQDFDSFRVFGRVVG